jgi:hypothetical protein
MPSFYRHDQKSNEPILKEGNKNSTQQQKFWVFSKRQQQNLQRSSGFKTASFLYRENEPMPNSISQRREVSTQSLILKLPSAVSVIY